MTRIIFVGAQGTGKTTILNMFRERGVNVITEVARNLVKEKGIKINQAGTKETQQMVFDTYLEKLSDRNSYISDRGLIDVMAYSTSQYRSNGVEMGDEYQREMSMLADFVSDNPDIIYVYFPIEFDVVPDGVRSTDENYRKEIDMLIHYYCERFLPDYLTVHGTPEERFRQILDWIGPNDILD